MEPIFNRITRYSEEKKYISKEDGKKRSEYDDIKDFTGYNSLRAFAEHLKI